MRTSSKGLVEIASHEGIVLRPYRDSVGVLTIFIGHTRAAGPPDPASFPRNVDQPLSMAFSVFRADIASFEAQVNRLVKVPLSQWKFDALVSFQYNTGGLGRSKLLEHLNRGDYHSAADAFMGWVKPPELIGRRTKEQNLFRNGVYSAKNFVTVFPVSASGHPVYSRGERIDVSLLIEENFPPDMTVPPLESLPELARHFPPPTPPKLPITPQQWGAGAAIAALITGLTLWGQSAWNWVAGLFGG